MVITELYIRNFGKLSEQHFYLRDGVQVISGENEFGKTTLHAFIRAMLFGMERGRGRAAAKDDFSRYEPWDNPGNYAGIMRFTCGGRSFWLERDFSRHTRHTSLVCEDDGEELSVEHGDLQVLLGGMTAELFDNTVSIGQMKAEPGQELSDALANYAANYYETGGGEFDLSGVLRSAGGLARAPKGSRGLRSRTGEAYAGNQVSGRGYQTAPHRVQGKGERAERPGERGKPRRDRADHSAARGGGNSRQDESSAYGRGRYCLDMYGSSGTAPKPGDVGRIPGGNAFACCRGSRFGWSYSARGGNHKASGENRGTVSVSRKSGRSKC